MSRLPSSWDVPKRYGLCPECGRKVSVTKEGRLRAHEPRTYRALSRVSPFGRGNCVGRTPVDTEQQPVSAYPATVRSQAKSSECTESCGSCACGECYDHTCTGCNDNGWK